MAHQVLKLLQQKPQQCGAIKTLNLFNKYLLLVTFETDDNYLIRFEISNNSSTARFNSFEMKTKHYSHGTNWQKPAHGGSY